MDTVVLVLMLLTAFNFLLKQTFWKLIAVGIITAICAVFAGLMWPYAIEQSKTQIANWLSNQPLMLDTSVLLSVEVCIQMAYAMLAVHVANDYPAHDTHVPFSPLVSGIIDFPGFIQRAGISHLCFSGYFISNDSMELCSLYPGSHPLRQIYTALFVAGKRTAPRTIFPNQCPGSRLGNCCHSQRKDFRSRCQ